MYEEEDLCLEIEEDDSRSSRRNRVIIRGMKSKEKELEK
jgi:hypothetical protein